jgi:hypothetical protein
LTPRSLPPGKLPAYNRQLLTANSGVAPLANHPGRQHTRFAPKVEKSAHVKHRNRLLQILAP